MLKLAQTHSVDRLSFTSIFERPEYQAIEYFRECSIAANANYAIELVKRLCHDKITNLIRALRYHNACIDASNLENRLYVPIVNVERSPLTAIWIHK